MLRLRLLVKRILCKPAFILVLLVLPAAMLTVSLLPEKTRSTEIVSGICIDNPDALTDSFTEYLTKNASGFTFRVYDDAASMKDDVSSGSIDSGYELPSGFSESFAACDDRVKINVYTTPATAFESVSSESVYAALLRTYSGEMSVKFLEDGYGMQSDYVSDYILSRFEKYISEDEVFTISGGMSGHYDAESVPEPDNLPVDMLVYITIFVCALAGLRNYLSDKDGGVYNALPKSGRISMLINNIAAGIIPAAIINLISLICYNGAGTSVVTLLSVCLCSAASLAAALVLSLIFRSSKSYTIALPFLIICTILLAVISQL